MKIIKFALLFIILLFMLTTAVCAASGTCGENASWEYDEKTKTLTISGTGDLLSYYNAGPWYDYNENIEKVIIKEGITTISNHAFAFCISLEEIAFPSTLNTIEEGAFRNCSSLKTVVLPDSLISLENTVFTQSGLESVILSNGMTLLDQASFSYCYDLKTVVIPNSITEIKGFVFYKCDNLETIYYTGSETEWKKIAVDNSENGNYPLYGDVDIVFDYSKNTSTYSDIVGKRYTQSTLKVYDYDYIPEEGFAFSDSNIASPPYVEFTDFSYGTMYLWNSFGDYFVDFTYTIDNNIVSLCAANNDTFGGTEKIVMRYDSNNNLLEVIDLNKPSNQSIGWTACYDIFKYNTSLTTNSIDENKRAETNDTTETTTEEETKIETETETETETVAETETETETETEAVTETETETLRSSAAMFDETSESTYNENSAETENRFPENIKPYLPYAAIICVAAVIIIFAVWLLNNNAKKKVKRTSGTKASADNEVLYSRNQNEVSNRNVRQNDDKIKCPICGYECEKGSLFCGNCGKKF